MMRSRPCSTLGLERTNGVLIWSNNMTSWSLSPVSSRLPCKRKNSYGFNQVEKAVSDFDIVPKISVFHSDA